MAVSLLRLVLLAAALPLAAAENVGCVNNIFDLVFVVDGSGSICQRQEAARNCGNWRNVLDFISRIVDELDIRSDLDHVGFVQFANTGRKEFGLNDYSSKSTLKNAIRNIQHESANTNTSGGIKVMRTQLFNTAEDRPDVPNIAIILTDGKSTRDKERTIPEAELANSMGIRTFSIGVTANVDENEVRMISSPPRRVNETYWLLKSFDALQTRLTVVRQIVGAFCQSEVIKPPPPVADEVGCPYQNSHRFENTCYQYRAGGLAWTEAEADCSRLRGHLAAVRKPTEDSFLSNLMKDYSSKAIWTGGRETTDKHWTYVSNGAILQGQGCYDDDSSVRDLSYKVPSIDALTPQKCIEACRSANYKYAGVQAGLHCYCGNDFGRYGLVQGCTITCPGDSRYKCGGFQSNYIYLVDGAWGEWSENQPNNFGGKQYCGALYYSHQYKYADEACDRVYQYLCQMPTGTSCSGTSVEGRYSDSVPENPLTPAICYFIGETRRDWVEARAQCFLRGGDLVTMMTAEEYVSVTRMLDSVSYNVDGSYMWAGVQKKTYTWTTGDRMWYMNWEDGSPSAAADECISIRSASGYKWRDETCTSRLSYFCQWDIPPTTTSTTTTATTTTTKTTTTPTSPVPSSGTTTKGPTTKVTTSAGSTRAPATQPTNSAPGNNGGSPDAAASTDLTSNSSTLTILTALIVILICVMIVTVCLLIYYNYMRRRAQVAPVVEQKHKTVKYNIYEPPVYEAFDPASNEGDTSHLRPNMTSPALENYKLSKTHTDEVDNDYDITDHVYTLQDEADRRAILGRKHKDSDTASENEEKKRKRKDRSGRPKRDLDAERVSRTSSPRRSAQVDSRPSTSAERY